MNNQVSHELLLTRTGGKEYRIQGKFSGEDVDSVFQSAEPLLSSSFLIKDYLKNKSQNKISFQEFSPVSPLSASASSIVSKGVQEDGTTLLKYSIHSQTYDFWMDKNGYRSLKMSMGPVKMILKRSFYDRK